MTTITEETYLEMKRIVRDYEIVNLFRSLNNRKTQEPYIKIQTINTELKYNKKFGDNKKCKCGHEYHRHFDSYENMENVGCKYCDCFNFQEAKP